MKNLRILFKIITVFYMGMITYLSLSPVKDDTLVDVNILHAPAYGILALCMFFCFTPKRPKVYILSFLASVSYGIFNEVLQGFVPYRQMSFLDVGLNAIGACVALLCVRLIKKMGTVL